ncbi:MAG: polysaccharide deacetylase family protein [Bacteroidales bacterium]
MTVFFIFDKMYLIKTPDILSTISKKNLTWRVRTQEPQLYLTFDDGPAPGITDEISNILLEKNVKATFFCIGQNIDKHPDIFENILAKGHTIGNHTYNHLNGWKTNNEHYYININAFHDIYPTKLFRPPYGKIKLSQIRKLSKDYRIILWSLLSGDFDPKITPEKCCNNVINNLHNGAVIVFHDNVKAMKNVLYCLPKIIDHAHKQGYHFKTLKSDTP